MEQTRPGHEPRPVEHETLPQAAASRTIAANTAAPVTQEPSAMTSRNLSSGGAVR